MGISPDILHNPLKLTVERFIYAYGNLSENDLISNQHLIIENATYDVLTLCLKTYLDLINDNKYFDLSSGMLRESMIDPEVLEYSGDLVGKHSKYSMDEFAYNWYESDPTLRKLEILGWFLSKYWPKRDIISFAVVMSMIKAIGEIDKTTNTYIAIIYALIGINKSKVDSKCTNIIIETLRYELEHIQKNRLHINIDLPNNLVNFLK